MNVTVKLFAIYQETVGVPELTLDVAQGESVGDLCDRLIRQHPQLERWRAITRFGINLEFVEPDTPLKPGDEVVFIPPVSGG